MDDHGGDGERDGDYGRCRRAEGAAEVAKRLVEERAGRGWDGQVYLNNSLVMLPKVCAIVGMFLVKLRIENLRMEVKSFVVIFLTK